MAGRRGLVGQGQRARAAIQSKLDEDGSSDHGRRDRAIPRQRLGKGHRACSGEKLVEKFGAEVLTVIETRTRTAIGGRDRPEAQGADCASVARSKASTRNHAVPAQSRRQHQPSLADI